MEVLQASLLLGPDESMTEGNVSLQRIEKLRSMVTDYERELEDRKKEAAGVFDQVD